MPKRKTGHKPTILDVARRASVSLGTVSNVLNNRNNVSDARRTRVLKAMSSLGYLPNTMAQSLRRQSSRIVGLCVPHTSSAYFSALIDASEEVAAKLGYEVMQVLSRQDPALELRRVRALLSHRVAGLIILPSVDPRETYDLLAASGVPAVVVDRASNDRRFDYVTIDDRKAMQAATRHLIDLGHKRLLYIVRYPKLVTTRQRIAGYRQAALDMQSGISAEVLERGEDRPAFARKLAGIMVAKTAPTAIVASNSAVALWLMKTLKDLRISCPQDVSVLVFDEPEWGEIMSPPLATVRHPTRAIARMAWELLVRRMEEQGGPAQRVTLEAELVPGESVAPPGVPKLRLRRKKAAIKDEAALSPAE